MLLIDKEGKTLKRRLLILLATLLCLQFSACGEQSAARFPAYDETTGKWGYIDQSGQWAIAPQFEQAGIYWPCLAGAEESKPLYAVKDENGLWGVNE